MAEEASTSPVFEFTDREFWGLDFCFRTFNKMYIKDILQLQEYPTFSGAFAYKNHPIYKVDVLGTVVRVEQRSKCFVYAVDDGTGVISCSCWKNNDDNTSDIVKRFQKLPPSLLAKVDSILSDELENEGYQLGDLLNVRGKIKVFRDMKEISASYHSKVANPVAEVMRMTELPLLYRQMYDKSFQMPFKVRQEIALMAQEKETGRKSQLRIIREISDAVRTHLTGAPSVHLFTTQDMIRLKNVQSVLHQICDNTESAYDSLVTMALAELEEQQGCICHRTDKRTYEVLLYKNQLQEILLQILVRETEKTKYSDKGCHYLHLLDELHKTVQYSKLHKTALLYCLEKLETNSDVIRTTEHHYKPCIS
ncbi:CST complex subunit STN1-like [Gigantopelta aegis]|uniref:CST complex subunit STN1-like n=1 Tax=Gigantopelta aegis TaxID=1735272 RepID=UPI001B88AB15|nr:CST complex subunit STN1-like [Gigantopelta aegis]XP_041376816.1 CST complex subunit STN1-like [Gigantopelta aegis]